MRLGQVIDLRARQSKSLDERNRNVSLSLKMRALLRRRVVAPLDGRRVWIEFETEAEAREFQKLIVAIKTAKKRIN